MDKKAVHMEIGAKKIEQLLKESIFKFLTEQQKSRVIHLVKVHDLLSELEADDEIALLEADGLGGLDINFFTPTFDKASNDKYMESVKIIRFPKFRSKYGKKKFEELFKLRQKFYENKA